MLIMKTLTLLFVFALLSFVGFKVTAQDNTEEKLNLPGDNLNLYAVMKLFQESETLEGFEQNLNAEDSKINNLDLNNDDKIDYIRVIDYVDGEAHTIVLQVAVNEKENQDVAVFTVQKDANKQVQVQLVGDQELYGKDYIIEPNYADVATSETPNPGYDGNTTTVQKETVVVTKTTYVEVAAWPVVTYMYMPAYVVYRSPWYWGYYPTYWSPWRPYYWDYYYGYHSHYHSHYYGHYRHSYYYRYPQYNNYYYQGYRSYSNTVNQHRQSGTYRNTYSRPDTRNQGSADFNKRYPNGYPASRPGVGTNAVRPSTKPGTNTNRPSTRPGTGTNVARPGVKPGTGTNVSRPNTKPGTGTNTSRPSVKPETNTNVNRPATKPGTSKPSTRPDLNKPSVKPGNTTPSARPGTSKPASKPSMNRPTSKPGSESQSVRPSANPGNKVTSPKQNSTKSSTPPNKSKSTENKSKGGR